MVVGQSINITNITTGGIAPPSGALVGGINTTNPWLTNSQIPNKPNATSLQNILGVNLTEATYTSLDPEHYTFLQSMAQISNQMRFFHLMDKDYGTGLTPTSLPDGCITNNGAFAGSVACDNFEPYKNMLNAFQNYKSISTVMGNNKDLHVNHSLLRNFPDTWYNINEWGGSYDDATKLMTVTNVRTNARNYAKKFAQSYCPTAINCIVKVLEVGNEPWGEPGWPAYREILKGYTDGLTDIYGTSISTWPMRISIGAMQFFQDETVPLNKTQKQGISPASTNIYSSDYAGYMIPSGFEQYISALNTHVYSVNNISYTVAGKPQTYYKEDFFDYTLKHPEDAASSFQKIKNMTLWKGSAFPNLKELNVTEFGWNSEDVVASNYFPASSLNNQCNCNSPLKSIPLVNGVRNASNTTTADISTTTSGSDWVVYVKNRNNVYESRGVGEKAQASYLIRAYLLMSRWGINKGFIYQSGDALTDAAYHHTGLIPQKIITTSTNTFEQTNLNNAHFDTRKKKSFYALAKLRKYLGTDLANAPTAGKQEKYFLYALKEDTQAHVYVFGTKQANGTYIPTEVIAWNPANINDAEQYDATTYLYDGQDTYSTGKFYKRKLSSGNEYVDFTTNHTNNQLTANLQVGLNIDAAHNFSNLQLDITRKSVLLDWNYSGSGYTGTWQDATPEKNNGEFVSSIASGQINFIKLTAIPVVIPITASGCVVNQDGTVSCSGCILSITPANPTLTNAIPSVTLTASGCTGTYTWTNPSSVTSTGATLNATAGGSYTVACSTAGCSPASISVTDNRTSACGITFNTFTQGTTTLAGCTSPTPYAYTVSFTASSALSNVTIPITNLPNNGANSQTSSPTGAINFLTQNSFNWVIPTVTAGTTYTATMKYCFNSTTPTATATYSCATISSGAGCTTAPTVPTIATPSSTALCNGSGVSLSTNCTTGNIQWYNGATLLSSTTSPLAVTAAGTYTAKCNNSCGTSGASNIITITNNVVAAPTLAAAPTTINSGQSSVLSTTGCTGTSTYYNATTNIALTSATVSPTSTTSYYAKCTVNGCQSTASTNVTVNVNASACPALSFTSFVRNVDAISTTQSPTIDAVNCKDYKLTISANSNASAATTIAITNLPSNGYGGFVGTGSLNYVTQTSYNWVIPTMTSGQSYSVTIKYCWASTWTTATATYSPCSLTINTTNNARLAAENPQEETEGTLFTIYPNPTNDKLTVEYNLTKDSEITFGIMDMTGKTLQNRTIDGKAGTHSFVMDVSKIIEGSYILRGIADDKSQAKKFVIVR
jgi:hypothetical protein